MTENEKIIKIIKKSLPAVVSVSISKYLDVFENPLSSNPFDLSKMPNFSKGKKKVRVGGGSGFIVDKSGIVLTNRHVVIDPKAEYVVILDNKKKVKAKVLARDPINDLAILKINIKKKITPLKLGSSSKLDLGQRVIAIGNSLGTFQNTVSIGVVSGLSRRIKAVDMFEKRSQRLKGLIQTDAAINPGNSGGPLIDIEGKVIGINAAMVFGAENVGFAIPVNVAKKDLSDLKKHGKIMQPFLGLRYIIIDKKIKSHFSLPVEEGALVVSEGIPGGEAIASGSPAEKAGLKELDIILSIQKKKITSKNPLQEILQECKVGEEIKLEVLRKNKKIKLKTVLCDKK